MRCVCDWWRGKAEADKAKTEAVAAKTEAVEETSLRGR
jgi:hypothetical protein